MKKGICVIIVPRFKFPSNIIIVDMTVFIRDLSLINDTFPPYSQNVETKFGKTFVK